MNVAWPRSMTLIQGKPCESPLMGQQKSIHSSGNIFPNIGPSDCQNTSRGNCWNHNQNCTGLSLRSWTTSCPELHPQAHSRLLVSKCFLYKYTVKRNESTKSQTCGYSTLYHICPLFILNKITHLRAIEDTPSKYNPFVFDPPTQYQFRSIFT